MITKNLDYYMSLPYTIRVGQEEDERDGWYATVDELPGCVAGGDTKDEALEMIEDAMRAWIGSRLERGRSIPEPDR